MRSELLSSSSNNKTRKKRRSWRKSDLNSVSEEDEGLVSGGGTGTAGEIEFSFSRILDAEKDSAALLRSGVSQGRNSELCLLSFFKALRSEKVLGGLFALMHRYQMFVFFRLLQSLSKSH